MPGNVLFWLTFCVFGQPMALLLYCFDFKHQGFLAEDVVNAAQGSIEDVVSAAQASVINATVST